MNLSPVVIGLGGKLRAGKDVVADHLVQEHGFVKVGMSDALHEAMLAIDPFVPVPIAMTRVRRWMFSLLFRREDEVLDFERYSALCARLGYVEAKAIPEVRRLLQNLGTEVGRNMIGENTWVNITARKVDDHLGIDRPVVVTGIRFPNEVAMIRQFAGVTVWVDRPGLAGGSASGHASENSVDASLFDEVLLNDGTIERLTERVDELLKRVPRSRCSRKG